MKLGRLRLNDWRQFKEIDLEFDSNLTILVGKNGSGKSTILKVLASMYGWDFRFTGATENKSEGGKPVYSNGIHEHRANSEFANNQIGTLSYLGATAPITPINLRSYLEQATANIEAIGNRPQIAGLHVIPSNAPSDHYNRIQSIPTTAPSKENALNHYLQDMRNHHTSGSYRNTLHTLKHDLSTFAVNGIGNGFVASDTDALAIFEGFTAVLQRLLPKELNFQKIEIRFGDVVFLFGTNAVNLESLSDGLQAIVNLAWQVFLLADGGRECVVSIDEPEAHLHPSTQRHLLPALVAAFPNVQFVVATHSPMMMFSTKTARLYALMFRDNGEIVSQLLPADIASISDAALRELLNLESSLALV